MRVSKQIRSAETPTFVDLFCGAGLLSAGFTAEGFTPILGVDLDRHALSSYEHNLCVSTLHSSVEYVPDGLSADILLAGPPCQGFSTLGRRDPKDERNDLSLCVSRWAKQLNSKVVVVENVPAFLQSPQHKTLVHDLVTLGYDVQCVTLEAADFGAPQFRKRAFTVASLLGNFETPRKTHTAPISVADAVFGPEIATDDPMHTWPLPSNLALERFKVTPAGGAKADIIKHRPDLCPPSWASIPSQATDVWGRMHLNRPSNTIRCTFQNPSKGRYIHPTEHRVISLREGARIQGIPDSWVFSGQPYPIARQIGNGVPVPLGQAIARSVRDVLSSALGRMAA